MAAWPLSSRSPNSELRKEVVAIRSPAQAEEVSARVAMLLRKPLNADTAVQIALLNNRGLQAAYNALGIARSRDGAGASAAVARHFRSSVCPTRSSSRSSGASSATSSRSRPCRRAPRSRRTASSRRNCARRKRRCASPREARRAFYRAVAARQSAALSRPGESGRRDRDQARQAPRRNRRHEQARPGARTRVLRRGDRAARHARASA